MARLGRLVYAPVGLGLVRHDMARHPVARLVGVWQGSAGWDRVRYGFIVFGAASLGGVRWGVVWLGLARFPEWLAKVGLGGARSVVEW